MTMINDYFSEKVLEIIKDKAISIKNRKILSKRLESFVEQQSQANINCTIEEEIDFANLACYICKKLPEDVEVYLFGEKKEREDSKENIIREAMRCVQKNTIPSAERIIKIVEAAFGIIRDFYRSQIDKERLFVAAQIEDTIISDNEQQVAEQTREIVNAINKIEKTITTAINENTLQYRKRDELPCILTKSVVPYADERSVIHRDYELYKIEGILKEKKTALLLSGFGGIGKSSLARVLYAKSAKWFDSFGWVEYHKNLKNSLLASLDLNNEIEDQEKRWKEISNRLKNDFSSKIIFIDNVDYDEKQGQDPQNDLVLQDITCWTNMTVVLTSRMNELHGYQIYPIEYLGNANQIEPCIDLFYFYYDKSELEKNSEERKQRNAVDKLVQFAGFHTYAIELLARSAMYEDDLSSYVEKIDKLGFRFPSLKISTYYSSNSATAAEQLRVLFNMQSRSSKQRQILWDFSVLPEGTSLSRDEVMELLLYSENDLHYLCQEGWLIFVRGQGFHIHPLVREAILLGLRRGKAPYRTVSHLRTLIFNNALISEYDTHASALRKLHMIEIAENYISFKSKEESSNFYYCLGVMEFKVAHKRLTSIAYLEKALQRCNSLSFTANIQYQLGYVKSTTHKYRDMAKNDLQAALDIWETLNDCEDQIAMTHDHLGYILMDSESTYSSSREHLTKAMHMRKSFVESNPTEMNLSAYSTTCDNLGYLFYKSGEKIDKSRELLEEALSIREKLYESSERYATDVAWTAHNLGQLLSKNMQCYGEAETYFRKALDIRRKLEKLHPQMYTTNIVFTLISLAKVISVNTKRYNEAQRLLDEAITLRSNMDLDYIGFFPDEVEKDIQILSVRLNSSK